MIDQYPSQNGVLTSLIWRKTAVGGETSLSGYDNANQALSYTPGQEQVYLNGILLVRGDDYTATNGTSITGLAALAANDFVQINCYNNFSVATLPTSGLTGTISNAQLQNSSITINGSAVSLGGSTTIAGGSAQDDAPTSPTEGQLWLDTNGTLATTGFTEKATLTTTGDIYYASAANTPARLGIGSTGQVLTVSGGVPSWSTISSGGMTQIASGSLTGSSVSLTSISQSYKDLILVMRNVSCATDNTYPLVGFNGLGSGNVYSSFFRAYGSSPAAAYDYINPFGSRGLRGTDNNASIYVRFNDYTTTSYKTFYASATGIESSALADALTYGISFGFLGSTSAVSSIQMFFNSGNFDNGTYILYGVS